MNTVLGLHNRPSSLGPHGLVVLIILALSGAALAHGSVPTLAVLNVNDAGADITIDLQLSAIFASIVQTTKEPFGTAAQQAALVKHELPRYMGRHFRLSRAGEPCDAQWDEFSPTGPDNLRAVGSYMCETGGAFAFEADPFGVEVGQIAVIAAALAAAALAARLRLPARVAESVPTLASAALALAGATWFALRTKAVEPW